MKFIHHIDASALQALLLAQGDIEVVSIYAVGATHYAWFRPKKEKQEVKQQIHNSKKSKG